MYKIEKITTKDGKERTDGRYPLRKGCICSLYALKEGNSMVVTYVKDNQGKDKSGYLKTSLVQSWDNYGEYLIVNTLNSVYHFRDIGKGD